jgi:hypothetical protein
METNGNAPVTRADLQEFRGELVKQIGELIDARIRQSEEKLGEQLTVRFQHTEEHFTERLHDTETRLLKAFYQYQEHSDVRMRKMSADISNMDTASDLRLNNLERRVIEIERKFLDTGR